jgi:hypothetical protein
MDSDERKGFRMKRFYGSLALTTLALALVLVSHPAWAQHGGGGGGGGGGADAGGSHSGSAGGSVISTSTSQLNLYGVPPFNGVIPQGHVIFTYSADFTFKSVELDITHVNITDGTVLTVIFNSWQIVSGRPVMVSTASYPLTINQGSGTLLLSTAATPIQWVPFLPPAQAETTVGVYYLPTPVTGTQLVGATFGLPILP